MGADFYSGSDDEGQRESPTPCTYCSMEDCKQGKNPAGCEMCYINIERTFNDIFKTDRFYYPEEKEKLLVQYHQKLSENPNLHPATLATDLRGTLEFTRKVRPIDIVGFPHMEAMTKGGYEFGFCGKINRCSVCGSEMMGRIKSYPPYCDSTYEEWKCPICGHGYGMSA